VTKRLKWHLDLEKQTGTPVDSVQLQRVALPLHPFPGCVGVAPEGDKEMGTGATGPYGGNMDFRYNTTGSIGEIDVYQEPHLQGENNRSIASMPGS
jgi:acetamidase/formamidase